MRSGEVPSIKTSPLRSAAEEPAAYASSPTLGDGHFSLRHLLAEYDFERRSFGR